ncbi:RNA polymerase sigma factor [Sinomicrobium weinanense]|uniref:Sigma-70 family RNA polymerase sigma factor n=1 Tax=Sinomicrobium weinanense TaxID=2842200 RepID=A0A926Q3Z9_9FLAO|nr:sigma-70 family RNA polymerase sigma factor [Sinomicrobium weinanense]MBC9796541.1 sigma-70 family RNA polymerase sigma factor [Sinomicrobium weinanense]MBU3123072.1 sigma-70 family RNA polymerase sigma factor [Sinomicrobium weinanense]
MEPQENIEHLWQELRKGSSVALGDIYDHYADILFAHGMRICGDRACVMDCIHDLFLDLYKYRKKLSAGVNVRSYLLRSLQRNINRKRKTREQPLFNDETSGRMVPASDPVQSVEEEFIFSEIQTEKVLRLKTSFDQLTDRQRQALALKFNEGKPYEEIAEIMNVSVETSRTLIYRAVKMLRKHFLPCLVTALYVFFRKEM